MTENGVMEECSDTGTVLSEEEGNEDVSEGHGVAEGEITAVFGCEEFQSCISCRGKVKLSTAVMGKCGKCGAKVKAVSLQG